jgi:NTE family protein
MNHEADGVFQGGGAKGLALSGALTEFADAKLHPHTYVADWIQLAGTSAGAIVAAYLACGHSAADTAALVARTDFKQFEDWGTGGEFLGGAKNLARVHGLAHGTVFRNWFAEQIGDKTFGDIARSGRTLKLIATDITRREMLVLPDALSTYRPQEGGEPIDALSFGIADAVRMSMSIPYFFRPIHLIHHESGVRSTIVDGGVLSNFPVWIFDVADHDPLRPTFGFKLIGGRALGSGLSRVIKLLGWPVEMGVDIFDTTTEAWDKYWVSHSTYVRTCTISAGNIGTIEFSLSDTQKQRLVGSGEQAARGFLERWDPAHYVNSAGRKLAAVTEHSAVAP